VIIPAIVFPVPEIRPLPIPDPAGPVDEIFTVTFEFEIVIKSTIEEPEPEYDEHDPLPIPEPLS
jgi:hypothetical protein